MTHIDINNLSSISSSRNASFTFHEDVARLIAPFFSCSTCSAPGNGSNVFDRWPFTNLPRPASVDRPFSKPRGSPRSLFKHSRGNRSRKRCIVWLAAGSLARVQIACDLSNRKRLEESAWTEDSMDIKRMASGRWVDTGWMMVAR